MKRILTGLISCAVILQFLPKPAFAAEENPLEYDGYIVRMTEDVKRSELEEAGCEIISDGLYYADTGRELIALSGLGRVEYCEPNYILSTQEDNYDEYETEQWSLLSVGASAAWGHKDSEGNRDRLGDGVTVAVIDSGVWTEHPDLQNADILDYIALSSEEDGLDDFHGTFITGILAAEVNNGMGIDGLVPNVTILPICITANEGKTDIRTAVQGILTAVEKGADVIVFSISGRNDNTALREICEYAEEQGVILVTCAGNYSGGIRKSENEYMYPAAYDSVVSVSACKKVGEGVEFDSEYSYFNNAINVSAPGTNILSLYLDGKTAARTGTSFAAPVAAAMAVMAKQAFPDMDKKGFIDLLKESSIDLGEPDYDVYYGHGYVNIPAFLSALDALAKGEDDPVPSVYTVTVNSGTADKISASPGKKVSLIADKPAKGKEFDKWVIDSGTITFDDENESSTAFEMPEENVEVTATFKDAAEIVYTITFDANGGKVNGFDTDRAETGSGGKLASLPNAIRTNYIFEGWYTEKTGGTKIYADTEFIENITIYAHWTYSGGSSGGGGGGGGGGGVSSLPQYTLTYETNGGSSISSAKHNKNDVVKLTQESSREGYDFTGWYSEGSLTNKITSIKMDGNKTVYAGWKGAEKPAEKPANPPLEEKHLLVVTIDKTDYLLRGQPMTMDSAPFIDGNDRTMLPVRVIANALGISNENISWDEETKTASFTREDGKVVSCTVNSNVIKIGDEEVTIDTVPVIRNDRIYLPMRALFNAFNVPNENILWDAAARTVTVTKKD